MTPAIPQPPDKCPACGAKVQFTRHGKLSSEQVLFFECGFMWHNESDGSVWNNKECTRSFSAAIALRQKLADENTANECLQDELTVLRAELAEAKRYSDHIEHESAALAVLHSNAVDERNALTARLAELQAVWRKVCECLKFQDGDTYEIMVRRLVPSILAFQMLLPEFSEQLVAALASGAAVEGDK